jgi:hypothetical protein
MTAVSRIGQISDASSLDIGRSMSEEDVAPVQRRWRVLRATRVYR